MHRKAVTHWFEIWHNNFSHSQNLHKKVFKFSVVLDSNGVDCQMVNMQIGGATTTTRSWDIKVTQYNCGDEDMGGKY